MHPSPTLTGRTAIVTGAARGLGRAIADRLAADGATVAAIDIEAGSDTSESVLPWTCDVTDTAAVTSTVEAVAARLGSIDILVNNAGLLSGRGSLLDASPEELHRFYDVNAVGALRMVQACFPYLRDSPHRGRIINIASRTFFTGAPGQIGYVASKGALIGMTRVMARELGEHRITVNAVMPAQVATPGTCAHSGDDVFARTMSQQAIQEFVTPEWFAGMVAFLASPDGALITGQSLVYDGGGLLH
ncbi:SDR family NAD(P)-dependent oxidoreductase [Rhodococcus opacus]|uniref:SDR family NAD(P)-dependent oxidoreductase n=1 Tax=Rhodococcus opacus TaxID=37919 RepID=UPI000EAAC2DA|nr:SDR family oxidoreductase [Rhodococcus opacus]QZS52491.1 SDR family oxidoreductase [Rhodococcus opacus]RKM64959.1 alcohol dehydrogenase [Rhodococcus opacus]